MKFNECKTLDDLEKWAAIETTRLTVKGVCAKFHRLTKSTISATKSLCTFSKTIESIQEAK